MVLSNFWTRINTLAQIELEPQIRRFFTAILGLTADHHVNALLGNIFQARKDLSEEHLAYLLWVAFQYEAGFPDLSKEEEFAESQIVQAFADRFAHIYRLCFYNHVTTNLPSRYAALQVVLSLLSLKLPSDRKTVMDLGCSLGLGLRSINTHVVRNTHTDDPDIYQLLHQEVAVEQFVGLDTLDIDSIDWNWMMACVSPEPQTIEGFESLESAYNWLLEHGTPIKYIRCDIFDIAKLISMVGESSADIIWSSNVLFQIGKTPALGLRRILPVVQTLLKPNGIWINADYTDWDYGFGTDANQYSVVARAGADLSRAYMVMTAPDDRVLSLEKGRDFKRFVDEIGS